MSGAAAAASSALLTVAGIAVLVPALYVALLALAARRPRAPEPRTAIRFDVIVPAHDEEGGIEATVQSLFTMAYPTDHFRVLVIADNCTDRTARIARGAGARVIERHDAGRRGKGYALATAIDQSAADAFADAVVVVDADTLVSANLLGALAARIREGAQAMQAEYEVRNPDASWRTRLTAIAFALFHTTRSFGRERLGLSCGLRGNGMCFTHALLREVPHRATSIVEDIEYGIALGLRGIRVVYVAEAAVAGEMPERGAAAASQRERWEQGRRLLVRQYLPALVRRAVTRRDPIALDLAVDLMVPPLTSLVMASILGVTASLYAAVHGITAWIAGLWLVSLVALIVYVSRGLQLSGLGLRGLVFLAWAPVFAVWKLTLVLRPNKRRAPEWVRTARERDR